jgi:molybdate transport repressor ModE-like protein
MKASTRITLWDDQGEKFFGEGPARLLRSVEEHGSLRAAAISMEMAYTKALKLIRQAESSLGYPLIDRNTGGKDGGGSTLTPAGKQLLTQYEAYRDACVRENQRLYRSFFPKTGCVIMASGMSIRFGENKLLADFCGKPMFLRAVEATEGLFDKRVVVTRHEEVAQLCEDMGIAVVSHDLPYRSDTIRLGLDALGDVDCCMFLPADQPLLRRDTVAMLLGNWREHPDRIVRPVYEDTEGSPVFFPAWTFPELKDLPEGKGGGVVIKRHTDTLLRVSVTNPFELADADTPEMLELLRQLRK